MQEVEVSYVLGSTFTRSQGHHFFRHGWIAVCRLLLVKGGGDFVFVVHWCAGYIWCICNASSVNLLCCVSWESW